MNGSSLVEENMNDLTGLVVDVICKFHVTCIVLVLLACSIFHERLNWARTSWTDALQHLLFAGVYRHFYMKTEVQAGNKTPTLYAAWQQSNIFRRCSVLPVLIRVASISEAYHRLHLQILGFRILKATSEGFQYGYSCKWQHLCASKDNIPKRAIRKRSDGLCRKSACFRPKCVFIASRQWQIAW